MFKKFVRFKGKSELVMFKGKYFVYEPTYYVEFLDNQSLSHFILAYKNYIK